MYIIKEQYTVLLARVSKWSEGKEISYVLVFFFSVDVAKLKNGFMYMTETYKVSISKISLMKYLLSSPFCHWTPHSLLCTVQQVLSTVCKFLVYGTLLISHADEREDWQGPSSRVSYSTPGLSHQGQNKMAPLPFVWRAFAVWVPDQEFQVLSKNNELNTGRIMVTRRREVGKWGAVVKGCTVTVIWDDSTWRSNALHEGCS